MADDFVDDSNVGGSGGGGGNGGESPDINITVPGRDQIVTGGGVSSPGSNSQNQSSGGGGSSGASVVADSSDQPSQIAAAAIIANTDQSQVEIVSANVDGVSGAVNFAVAASPTPSPNPMYQIGVYGPEIPAVTVNIASITDSSINLGPITFSDSAPTVNLGNVDIPNVTTAVPDLDLTVPPAVAAANPHYAGHIAANLVGTAFGSVLTAMKLPSALSISASSALSTYLNNNETFLSAADSLMVTPKTYDYGIPGLGGGVN